MNKKLLLAVLILAVAVLTADAAIIKVKVAVANVRAKPDANAGIVTRISMGQQYEPVRKIAGWYEIAVADASGKLVSGFIREDLVEEVAVAAEPRPAAEPARKPAPAAPPVTAAPPAASKTSGPAPAAAPKRPGAMIFASYGMLQPGDSVVKDVYANPTVMGAELRFRLSGGVYLSLSGGYYSKTGSLTLTKESTKITNIPVEALIVVHFLNGMISPYAGAGGAACFYNEENVIGTAQGSAFGFAGCAGVTVRLGAFGLDARARYSSVNAKNGDVSANLGGLTFSVGAGILF